MKLLLDTHVWLWLLDSDRRLGRRARSAIDRAVRSEGATLSVISLWEVALLVAKQRIALESEVGEWMQRHLSLPGFHLLSLTLEIAVESTRLPGKLHGDPADRFLAASARCLGLRLITADRRLLDYGRAGHVEVIDATG